MEVGNNLQGLLNLGIYWIKVKKYSREFNACCFIRLLNLELTDKEPKYASIVYQQTLGDNSMRYLATQYSIIPSGGTRVKSNLLTKFNSVSGN